MGARQRGGAGGRDVAPGRPICEIPAGPLDDRGGLPRSLGYVEGKDPC